MSETHPQLGRRTTHLVKRSRPCTGSRLYEGSMIEKEGGPHLARVVYIGDHLRRSWGQHVRDGTVVKKLANSTKLRVQIQEKNNDDGRLERQLLPFCWAMALAKSPPRNLVYARYQSDLQKGKRHYEKVPRYDLGFPTLGASLVKFFVFLQNSHHENHFSWWGFWVGCVSKGLKDKSKDPIETYKSRQIKSSKLGWGPPEWRSNGQEQRSLWDTQVIQNVTISLSVSQRVLSRPKEYCPTRL